MNRTKQKNQNKNINELKDCTEWETSIEPDCSTRQASVPEGRRDSLWLVTSFVILFALDRHRCLARSPTDGIVTPVTFTAALTTLRFLSAAGLTESCCFLAHSLRSRCRRRWSQMSWDEPFLLSTASRSSCQSHTPPWLLYAVQSPQQCPWCRLGCGWASFFWSWTPLPWFYPHSESGCYCCTIAQKAWPPPSGPCCGLSETHHCCVVHLVHGVIITELCTTVMVH